MKEKEKISSICFNKTIEEDKIVSEINMKKTIKLTIFSSIVFILFLLLRHRMILYKTYGEQKMSLFSETGFYYSFYDEIVSSPESIMNILMNKMVFDRRTEYPDTINSISRFNIYQEILFGLLYRFINDLAFKTKYLLYVLRSIIYERYSLKEALLNNFNNKSDGFNSFVSPFNFYYYAINTILGIGMGFLCGTSTYISDGSYSSGLICMGFLFGNFQSRLLSRISSLPLRENFALPFIWINNLILISIIRENKLEKMNRKWFLFFLSSLIQIEFWQFSVFVIATQMISVFTLFLLGYNHEFFEQKLVKLVKVHLSSLMCSYFMHFCNSYILFSPAVLIGISILSSVLVPNLFSGCNAKMEFSLARSFYIGLSSLATFAFIKQIVSPFSGDDSHVYDLLKSAFFGEEFTNFDTMIYKMGGSEFSWITGQQLKMINDSGVLYFFIPNFFIVLSTIIIDLFTNIYNSHEFNTKTENLQLDSPMIEYDATQMSDDVSLYSSSSNSSMISSSTTSSLKSNTISINDWMSCNEYAREQDYSIVRTDKQSEIKEHLNVSGDTANGLRGVKQKSCILYLFIQTVSFCVLAIIISRLRVLAIPYISVFSSLLASKSYLSFLFNYYKKIYLIIFKRNRSNPDSKNPNIKTNFLIGIVFKLSFLLLLISMFSVSLMRFPLSEMRSGLISENNSSPSKSRLVDWINSNLPDGTPILADMVVSSTLRLMTNASIITHPQYEHIKIRKRTQFVYSISACISIKELYETMYETYKTEYLLLSIYRCATPNSKEKTITVIDVTEYLDNIRHRCNNRENIFQRTCWRIQLDDNSRYFELVYRNPQYSIYKRINRNKIDTNLLNSDNEYDLLNNYSQFPYSWKLLDWSRSWKPWIIDHCIKNDRFCPQNMVDYARMIIDIYNLIEVSKMIYEKALSIYSNNSYVTYSYAEFLDFDYGGNDKVTREYYSRSISLVSNNNLLQKSSRSVNSKEAYNTIKVNAGFVLKMIIGFILYNEQTNARNENTIILSLELILENNTIKDIALSLNKLDKNEIIKYLNSNIVDVNYDMCLNNLVYNICMISSYLRSVEIDNKEILMRQKRYPNWLGCGKFQI